MFRSRDAKRPVSAFPREAWERGQARDAKRPMSAFPREAWERGQSLFIRLDLAAISSGERGQLAQQINFDVFPP